MSNLSGSGTLKGALSRVGGTPSDVYWDDILDKPEFAEVATSGSYNDLTDKPTLATVATSGSYNDLTDKPTIPVYTAGNGIDITNNVISATGGGGQELAYTLQQGRRWETFEKPTTDNPLIIQSINNAKCVYYYFIPERLPSRAGGDNYLTIGRVGGDGPDINLGQIDNGETIYISVNGDLSATQSVKVYYN